MLGQRVEADPRGDAGVERVGTATDRDTGDDVAPVAHQPREASPLGADHQHQRQVGVDLVDRDLSVGVQPDDEEPCLAVGGQRPRQVGALCHRDARCRT